MHYLTIFIAVLILSVLATGGVLAYLRHKAILDHPNERSSHSIPTPRGGGIGMLIVILPALIGINFFWEDPLAIAPFALGGAFVLALLSWLDDLRDLGAGVRFAVQFICVGLCVFCLPPSETGYIGGFMPVWLEKILLVLGWVWFINLFNFMDGIDGISGVEIASIGAGLALFGFALHLGDSFILTALVLCASALGFLKWNWHPAKVFMGDVGSIPIGFLLGWMLILLAGQGFVLIAVLIALYYMVDATFTLIKRLLRGEKVWQAHREHFYQQATQKGLRHDQVALRILALNMVLIASAWVAYDVTLLGGLALAILSVTVLLFHFKKGSQNDV